MSRLCQPLSQCAGFVAPWPRRRSEWLRFPFGHTYVRTNIDMNTHRRTQKLTHTHTPPADDSSRIVCASRNPGSHLAQRVGSAISLGTSAGELYCSTCGPYTRQHGEQSVRNIIMHCGATAPARAERHGIAPGTVGCSARGVLWYRHYRQHYTIQGYSSSTSINNSLTTMYRDSDGEVAIARGGGKPVHVEPRCARGSITALPASH